MNGLKLIVTLLIVILVMSVNILTASDFDSYFLDKTMRVDYFHTGIKDVEIISLDKVYEEPAVATHDRKLWAGNRLNLLDTLNLGKYMFREEESISQNQLPPDLGYSVSNTIGRNLDAEYSIKYLWA